MTTVSVDGHNQANVVVTMQTGMTVSGHVGFEGTGTASAGAAAGPPNPQRVRVSLQSANTGSGTADFTGGVQPAQVGTDGAFTLTGVAPGKYFIRAQGGQGFTAKSAMAAGRDALDFPLEIRAGDNVVGLMVTLSDKATQLSGTLQDSSGRPTPDYTIVVFATDKSYWTPQSRRIQSTRPGTDGTFTIRNLPPGDYRIAAVTDVEPGEWFDPAFLEQLRTASTPVTLSEGEKKTQDLRIAGGF